MYENNPEIGKLSDWICRNTYHTLLSEFNKVYTKKKLLSIYISQNLYINQKKKHKVHIFCEAEISRSF